MEQITHYIETHKNIKMLFCLCNFYGLHKDTYHCKKRLNKEYIVRDIDRKYCDYRVTCDPIDNTIEVEIIRSEWTSFGTPPNECCQIVFNLDQNQNICSYQFIKTIPDIKLNDIYVEVVDIVSSYINDCINKNTSDLCNFTDEYNIYLGGDDDTNDNDS